MRTKGETCRKKERKGERWKKILKETQIRHLT